MMKRRLTLAMMAAVVFAAFLASAIAAQDAPRIDVTGAWTFQVETTAGAGTPAVTFKQDGDKLTGHYTGQLGDLDFSGTVKGKDISFSFSTEVQGIHIDVTYAGTIESKDTMKGTIHLGDVGNGTFTARRQ
jgi:opacity protein-like surface antigen